MVVVPVTVELESDVGSGVVDGNSSLLLLVGIVLVDEGVSIGGLDEDELDDDGGVVVVVRVVVGVEGGVDVSEVSVGTVMVGVVTGSLVVSVGGVGVDDEPFSGTDGVELFETPLPCRWRIPKRRFCSAEGC